MNVVLVSFVVHDKPKRVIKREARDYSNKCLGLQLYSYQSMKIKCRVFTGYVCEQYNNPPDFFLDVINGDCTAVPQSEGA